MINCHIHTFKDVDIPEKFLPLKLVRILSTKVGFKIVAKVLNWINPFTTNDQFDRYVTFIKIGKLGSQKAIFENCKNQYPQGTKFVVLPMDMAFMGAGEVPRKYRDQLVELSELSNKPDADIISFIHIDCRRENYFELFKEFIELFGFKGLKLYPPLGTFPYDERYLPIYKYCEENNIPVLAHCTAGNPVHFKGSHKELVQLLRNCKLKIDWNKKDSELCSYFTHPEGYKYVLKAFPKLRVCLAHFGRENEWDEVIKDMMTKYDNLYTDISFSLYDTEHWGNLKVLLSTNEQFRTHCLFGTDYYMIETESTEKQFCINLRAYLGEELFTQISVTNPNKFLGIEK